MKQLTAIGRVAKNIIKEGGYIRFKLVVRESFADVNGEERQAETVIACVAKERYAYAVVPGACLLVEGNANTILRQKEGAAPIAMIFSDVHTLVSAKPGSDLNFVRFNMIGNIGGSRISDVNAKRVCNFTVAHNEKKDGVEVVEWANCAMWRDPNRASIFEYLNKGGKVYVSGRPIARAYESNGQYHGSFDVTVATITLLGGKSNSGDSALNEVANETDVNVPDEADDLPF